MSLVSVILNVYKRPEMLNGQLEAVMNQSVSVQQKNIHVIHNAPDFIPFPNYKVKEYDCNWNTKFHGRFAIALLCDSEYVAIFDDDLLPGKDWLRNCINTMNTKGHNGIMGGSGVLVGDLSRKFHKFGWNGIHNEHTERVDFVGQAWVFRQEWAKYMWYEKPYSWDNGEDIMFAYLAQKYGGINSFVPPHPEGDKDKWCTDEDVSMGVGRDENATWRKGGHNRIRKEIITHCVSNGWQTI